MPKPSVHLVRVTADDRQERLWVAATPREAGVGRCAGGMGSCVAVQQITAREMEILNLRPGEVREITNPSDPIRRSH